MSAGFIFCGKGTVGCSQQTVVDTMGHIARGALIEADFVHFDAGRNDALSQRGLCCSLPVDGRFIILIPIITTQPHPAGNDNPYLRYLCRA
jgi:hypothetical protein